MDKFVSELANRVLENGAGISADEAARLCDERQTDLHDLLYWSNRIREKHFGDAIDLCSIVNAKSGKCPEDCRYCAQSSHYKTKAVVHSMISCEDMVKAAKMAKEQGSKEFGIVTSGREISAENEIAEIEKAVKEITTELNMKVCGCLGTLSEEHARRLFAAGMQRYNHNLETAESYFPLTCTTHEYKKRVDTVRLMLKLGYKMCCGGIFGMGESWEQRAEFAFTLRDLGVDCCNMNFLNPIPGTPMENQPPVEPREVLRIVGLFRFIMHDRTLRLCGGRERNLRQLQSWMFYAGANAIMLGNYLTTAGRPPEEDIQLLNDLGLKGRMK